MTTTPAKPPGLDGLMAERRQLINIAYRLLGSLTDAEDAVQEAYARWFAMPQARQGDIRSPGAWLTTVTSRICLDLLGSARSRREQYVGAWIPEPLPEPTEWVSGRIGAATPDPADRVTLDETVSMAFLLVIDSMTPAQRVSFILHDVFGYPFADVATIVGRTPAACRKLASSARRRISSSKIPLSSTTGQACLVRKFKQAWEAKDVTALIDILDPGATVTADGGGQVPTASHPLKGPEEIAHYLLAIVERVPDMVLLERTVNGRPGLVAQSDGTVEWVAAFGTSHDRIEHIWAVRNPEKLRQWMVDDRSSPEGSGG